jgi:hypothetical protein
MHAEDICYDHSVLGILQMLASYACFVNGPALKRQVWIGSFLEWDLMPGGWEVAATCKLTPPRSVLCILPQGEVAPDVQLWS